MRRLARFVLRHGFVVVGVSVAVLAFGVVNLGRASDSFSQSFSVPGREGFETNERILRTYGVDTLTDALGSGPEVFLKVFATGLAVGILLDATVVRMLLVPSLVALFGRWNWWLPRSAARVLRVDASEPVPETPPALARAE